MARLGPLQLLNRRGLRHQRWPRHLLRGVRVNTVNPDAVLRGSRIWGSSWREQRTSAYGIDPDHLEEHYRTRTMLGVHVLPGDDTHARLQFASDERSGKTTRNILNVAGGVAAAFPR